jgi:hypothetical protein
VNRRSGASALWNGGMTIHSHWPSACPKCPIKVRCTPSDYRRLRRWEHEKVLDAMQRRLDRTPKHQNYAGKPANRRAPLRHAESLDGSSALLDENAPEDQNGDELARARLQPEACDEDRWDATADPGYQGVGAEFLLLRPLLLYRWTECTHRMGAARPRARVQGRLRARPYGGVIGNSTDDRQTRRTPHRLLRRSSSVGKTGETVVGQTQNGSSTSSAR